MNGPDFTIHGLSRENVEEFRSIRSEALKNSATQSDPLMVSGIVREAAEWLRAAGQPMWRNDELRPDRIALDVETGLFHLAYDGNEPARIFKFQLARTPDSSRTSNRRVLRDAVMRLLYADSCF